MVRRLGWTLPLIEHWDGRRWTVSFTEDAFGLMSDVLASSPRDVWAVGRRRVSPAGSHALEDPVVMHWDGTQWRRVRAPGRPPALLGTLSGIPATIWATAGLRQRHYAFARWDGRRWTFVLGPTVKTSPSVSPPRINDLAVASPTDILAVGSSDEPGAGIVLRWDGTRWSPEQAPPVYRWDSVDTAAGETWAIGDDGLFNSVIARCIR